MQWTCSRITKGPSSWHVNNHASRWTKHIDMKHHLVWDVCDAGKVRVVYIRTEYQHADLVTKPLGMQTF